MSQSPPAQPTSKFFLARMLHRTLARVKEPTGPAKLAALAALAGSVLVAAILTYVAVYLITKQDASHLIKANPGARAGAVWFVMIPFIAGLLGMIVAEKKNVPTGWILPGLVTGIGICSVVGSGLGFYTLRVEGVSPLYAGMGYFLMALAAGMSLFFIVEWGFLRLLSLTQLGAIARITYYEALLQPFTLIVLGLGIATIAIFAFIPFFTQNEDIKIFRDVGMSFTFIFTLPVMIFSSSKVIDEEIENRTMLTLMSKPVMRWQVVLGKYLGVLNLCFVVMAMLAVAVAAAAYVRYFDEMRIDYMVADTETFFNLDILNDRAVLALLPSFLLKLFQISTLAAVAVAISTRFPLALNITVIVLLYLLANLTQFVDGLGLAQPWQSLASWGSTLLPHLNVFDIDQRLIYGGYTMTSDLTAPVLNANDRVAHANYINSVPSWGAIWRYVGACAGYALIYIGAALAAAIALFRTRELT